MKTILIAIAVCYLAQTVSCGFWNPGDGVYWANNCDWHNRDSRRVGSRGEDCGRICVNDRVCTHFAWSGGWCYLKYGAVNQAGAHRANGVTCGFQMGFGRSNLQRDIDDVPEEGDSDNGVNSDDDCSQALMSSIVDAHNQYRARHGAKNLVADSDIQKLAKEYSRHLVATGKFDYSNDAVYGENLWMSRDCSFKPSAESCKEIGKVASKAFYDEIKKYNFDNPVFSNTTQHFTQMVWKATTKIGCGLSVSKDYCYNVLVCNYFKAGNVPDQFKENVQKVSSRKLVRSPETCDD